MHFEGGVLKPLKAVNLHEVLHSGLCQSISMNMKAKVEEFAKLDSGALKSRKLYRSVSAFRHNVLNSRFT